MRFAFLLACLPGLALAEDFTLPAPATEAVIHASGATVTRQARIDLPAGSHRLLVPVMPTASGPPRVTVEGAVAGAQSVLVDALVDGREVLGEAQEAAYDAWMAAREDAARAADERQAAAAAREAAEARLSFLRSISGAELTTLDAAAIAATANAVGDEVRAAQVALSQAQAALRAAERDVEDAERDLAQAKRDFDATGADLGPVTLLAIGVSLAAGGPVDLTMTEFSPRAGWSPLYDARLSEAEGSVTLVRKAEVFQATGLALDGIALRLSTADPFAPLAPTTVLPDLAQTGDPKSEAPAQVQLESLDMGRAELRVAPAAEPLRAQARTDGPVVSYDYPVPVSLPAGGGTATLLLDTLEFDARVFNRAAPRHDETAFLMAEWSNGTAEPLLAGPATLFREGARIGETYLPAVPAGDETETAFGPQEHLRLEFRRLDNEAGDRGLFVQSGTRRQDMLFRIRNLSAEAEVVETRFALPYSEEEALEIDLDISPAPDRTDVEERTAVAEWTLEVPARGQSEVRIGVGLQWPEGRILDWEP